VLKAINTAAPARPTATPAPATSARTRGFAPITREQPRLDVEATGPLATPRAPGTAEPGAAERQLTNALERKQHIERAFDRAMRRKDASPEELLRLQMQVNEYSLQLDTASRLVERLTSAVKQTMNTQV